MTQTSNQTQNEDNKTSQLVTNITYLPAVLVNKRVSRL